MSGAPQADPNAEYLLSAIEYRDHLQTELAKVNEFLRVAGKNAASSEREDPDFLLLGGSEILGAMRAKGWSVWQLFKAANISNPVRATLASKRPVNTRSSVNG